MKKFSCTWCDPNADECEIPGCIEEREAFYNSQRRKVIIPAYKGWPMSVRDLEGIVIAEDEGEVWVRLTENSGINKRNVDVFHHVTVPKKEIKDAPSSQK